MNWVKGFALVTCLATPLSVITAASADPAPAATTPAAPAAPATTAPATTTPAKPAMSDADKRAKAADCSKQADAKGLHGEARKKFRAACKHK